MIDSLCWLKYHELKIDIGTKLDSAGKDCHEVHRVDISEVPTQREYRIRGAKGRPRGWIFTGVSLSSAPKFGVALGAGLLSLRPPTAASDQRSSVNPPGLRPELYSRAAGSFFGSVKSLGHWSSLVMFFESWCDL